MELKHTDDFSISIVLIRLNGQKMETFVLWVAPSYGIILDLKTI